MVLLETVFLCFQSNNAHRFRQLTPLYITSMFTSVFHTFHRLLQSQFATNGIFRSVK